MPHTLPRLTRALRAFSNVSVPLSDETFNDKDVLRKKAQIAESATKTLPWATVKEIFQSLHEPSLNQINSALKDLLQQIKVLLKEDCSEQVVEGLGVFVLSLFKDAKLLERRHVAELQKLFGTPGDNSVQRLFGQVHKMLSWLPESTISVLFDHSDNPNADLMSEPFDFNVKFETNGYLESDTSVKLFKSAKEERNGLSGFSFQYTAPAPLEHVPPVWKKPEKQVFDSKWMSQEIHNLCDESTSNDVVSSVTQLLMSSRTNDELQSELCDLLGFQHIALLTTILEHRKDIAKSCQLKTNSECNGKTPSQDVMGRPAYGCQVTIQSELEKTLIKHIRKEDRKLQKDMEKSNDNGDSTASFDPEYLRRQRNNQLIAAMQMPLFSNKNVGIEYREQYPNVYDSFAEAKLSSAYIGGAKMMMPLNADRKSNSKFEEVTIPANDPQALNVKTKFVSVSDLDEVGQLGFQGMKSLNRIQSMVFDTAYYTNENLLICAPTGAGKTNVAMLAILHQIKQHMEGSVVLRDKFKIIYVAPMKALAAEMVRNFSKRLAPLGINVRELTGDMQPTKAELTQTQMLVTTPEKWDVVTRKATGDVALAQLVKLLILDEVHLLHGDRGPVLEALVARTIRQVESTQNMIRIVGLSATLPNYLDVASFLRVNPYIGLFFFDGRFRPVPLTQTFIGVKESNPMRQLQEMDDVCYQKAYDMVRKGHQVMIFVHARNATVRTAMILKDLMQNKGHSQDFAPKNDSQFGNAQRQMMKSRNKQLRELFEYGFSIHHAGMLRSDRNLVERFFSDGFIKVLVCTATLAWGVNLPAHAVIIKGTEIYDSKHGSFVDLGILDVMQIFGRAGRPQFDKTGHGMIITSHEKLSYYLSLLTSQYPIESNFVQSLTDNLNAEISLGTVSNINEAIDWLSYTYLYVRMRKNPLVYGITYKTVEEDPSLEEYRKKLIVERARELDRIHMIRFDEVNGFFHALDKGRTASHYYIKHATVETFKDLLESVLDDAQILAIVSNAQEFDQLKVREDEMDELDRHLHESCNLPVAGGSENTHGKVNILLQAHISRTFAEAFSLVSDQAYVVQNGTRILRALFEMVLKKNMSLVAGRILVLCRMMERRQWDMETPLRQFPDLSYEIVSKIEHRDLTIHKLREMDSKEIGQIIHHYKMGGVVKSCVNQLPCISITSFVQPITRNVLRIKLEITPGFEWNDKVHGKTGENFWIWVEGPNDDVIYHTEYFMVTKKQVINKDMQSLIFTIPIRESLPPQYFVRAMSDKWLGCDGTATISFLNVKLPSQHIPVTELLDLQPLPKTALKNAEYESIFKFSHFNPIQTQLFHTLYHTEHNVLLGAPTGSGKTIVAEIAMFKVFRDHPGTKVVYIAPLKALVRERIEDWKVRLQQTLKKSVVELTGDATPDARAISLADVIVTTPEKWDGISRSWQTRNYVQDVSLIVIDEIHLLGEDRGPVLEVIVSRTNYISAHTERPLRLIGLSTAIANAIDLASWLGIKEVGLYNFKPSVRPVQLQVHIEGFPGKHYCPRMALMNKPAYRAIQTHSPEKPTLIFVSSRRQTRLTALDLIAYLAAEDNPKKWVNMPDDNMESILSSIKEQNLKLTLSFGIGLHHAGLQERDRRTVEELFSNQKIQVLVATATLAWGINLPAHLVIVKGTEYFDGKTRRYVDFPVTDVLQMVGRAGRPQYDDEGVAVVLVQDSKKDFYKKFLYNPFPVESCLLEVLPEHLNAEIVAGTITSRQDCLDYLTWTYFFRRLLQNPSYYHLMSADVEDINPFMSKLIDKAFGTLSESFCLELEGDEGRLAPTILGRIASYYYLSHVTMKLFKEKLSGDLTVEDLLQVLTMAQEYSELPVRHNEDAINGEFSKLCPIEVDKNSLDSPHTKTHLLLQGYFSRLSLPSTDYNTDLKSVLDQAIRITQAMIDVSADQGWLSTTLGCMLLLQMILQARWHQNNSILTLPYVEEFHLAAFSQLRWGSGKTKNDVQSLPELINAVSSQQGYNSLAGKLRNSLNDNEIEKVYSTLKSLPVVSCYISLKGLWDSSLKEETRTIALHPMGGIIPDHSWVNVHADQEYIVYVELNRISRARRHGDTKALTPQFPKPKEEGWFLVLGNVDDKELIAMKRIGNISKRSTHRLLFYTPEKEGRVIYTLFLMSDCYLSLDQQYDIHLDVTEANIAAQINSEVSFREK